MKTSKMEKPVPRVLTHDRKKVTAGDTVWHVGSHAMGWIASAFPVREIVGRQLLSDTIPFRCDADTCYARRAKAEAYVKTLNDKLGSSHQGTMTIKNEPPTI